MAFERLARRGIGAASIVETLNRAYISPVLTAHPTEVQRKSILDAERAIAELLAARTPERRRASSPTTRRCCAPASPSSGRRGCCAPPS
jgi:phosphoenolpyruvate carboxylase